MKLSFDGLPEVEESECRSCGRSYQWVCGFIARSGDAFAIYYAECHAHDEDWVVWLDVVVGSWEEPGYEDQETFSCRIGQEGAGLVDAPRASRGESPFSGVKLDRQAALASPRLGDVWAVVDFVVAGDPTVAAYLHVG